MKIFSPHTFNLAQARRETDELRNLLQANPDLSERKTILPFFQKRPNLIALCGILSHSVSTVDQIGWEFELFGDYSCDFVVGDSVRKTYRFIEFEDASKSSIFEKRGKKSTREWSKRFLGGYTQIVDWFCIIEDMRRTNVCTTRFGSLIKYDGMLVIGRDSFQDVSEMGRLHFFRNQIASNQINCLTFDELHYALNSRLDILESATIKTP